MLATLNSVFLGEGQAVVGGDCACRVSSSSEPPNRVMKQHARRMQTSSHSSRGEIQTLVPLALVALVAVVLSSQASLMEARYLPTRADESNLAVLEDLIRLVSTIRSESLRKSSISLTSRPLATRARFWRSRNKARRARPPPPPPLTIASNRFKCSADQWRSLI